MGGDVLLGEVAGRREQGGVREGQLLLQGRSQTPTQTDALL